MENLRKVLEDCGSSLKHVVQTRNFVRDPEDGALFNQLYREYFSAPFPARTTLSRLELSETLLGNRKSAQSNSAISLRASGDAGASWDSSFSKKLPEPSSGRCT